MHPKGYFSLEYILENERFTSRLQIELNPQRDSTRYQHSSKGKIIMAIGTAQIASQYRRHGQCRCAGWKLTWCGTVAKNQPVRSSGPSIDIPMKKGPPEWAVSTQALISFFRVLLGDSRTQRRYFHLVGASAVAVKRPVAKIKPWQAACRSTCRASPDIHAPGCRSR
jgi:hypothetical protein